MTNKQAQDDELSKEAKRIRRNRFQMDLDLGGSR